MPFGPGIAVAEASSYSSHLAPSREISLCCRWDPEKKKKKEEESKELRSVSTYEVVARIKSIPVGDCVLGPNSSAFCVLFM